MDMDEIAKKALGKKPNPLSKTFKKPISMVAREIAREGFRHTPSAVHEVAKSGAKGLIGGSLGAIGGVLLNPTEAGAGSDKIPPPSERQRKIMNVDNSGLKKEKLP